MLDDERLRASRGELFIHLESLLMMTLVHVTTPAAYGGLERVVAGLCTETAARGHRVVLVLLLLPEFPVPEWASKLSASNVVLEPLHIPRRAYLRERSIVRTMLSQYGASVLHTHGYRADVLHASVARSLGIALVSTAHGFASLDTRGRFYEWLQRRVWRGFDAVVAVSQPLLDTLARAGVGNDRLMHIRTGLSSASPTPLPRAEARRRLNLPADRQVLGWVGRMSDEKSPSLAIEALARTPADGPVLCMVGGGPQLQPCRRLATELGVGDRVVFAGPVPDAAPLLGAFDGLVLSSKTEGTPMVVLEASAASIPVIATAVGGVPELLRDDGGWLVPPGDATALAAAIMDALVRPLEAERRAQRLRRNLAGNEGGPDWIDQYLALYARLSRSRL